MFLEIKRKSRKIKKIQEKSCLEFWMKFIAIMPQRKSRKSRLIFHSGLYNNATQRRVPADDPNETPPRLPGVGGRRGARRLLRGQGHISFRLEWWSELLLEVTLAFPLPDEALESHNFEI